MTPDAHIQSLVDNYIKAKKTFFEAREELSSRINAVTEVLNAASSNIGHVMDDQLGWDIEDIGGITTIHTLNSYKCYGEYCTDDRYIPLKYLAYDPINPDGSGSPEWDLLREVILEKKRKEAEERERQERLAKIREEKRKAAEKEKRDRAEYERLKAKYEHASPPSVP